MLLPLENVYYLMRFPLHVERTSSRSSRINGIPEKRRRQSIHEYREENKAAWFINNSIWSRTFAEQHLRPLRSRFFLVSSISSLLYFHHFRASPRSVYASVPTIGLCLRDCYIRSPTITPPSSRFGFEKRRVEMV